VTRVKIKALWEQGVKQRRIAREVGCGLATVARWVQKFKKTEAAGIPDNIAVRDKRHPGATPKISNSIGKAILRFTSGKPNRHLSAIRNHVQQLYGVTLTCMGISKWLRKEGLHAFHRTPQPRLLERHKKKRVIFARAYLNHNWGNTLFTDETEILLNSNTLNSKNDVVWAKQRDDVPPLKVQQYSEKVRVWGGISAKGNTKLIIYDGDLTTTKYRELLIKAKPDFDAIFGPGT
jgi:transposase